MSLSLKDQIRSIVADPSVAAIIAETVLNPVSGPGAAIAPATYARTGNNKLKTPNFAFTEKAFVLKRSESGWHDEIVRSENGRPCLEGRVVIDSVASQSGRAESALWEHRADRLGIDLPGLVLSGTGEEASGGSASELREMEVALQREISSWNAAHRQVDGWFRAATLDGSHQLWEDSASGESVKLKNTIASANAEDGEALYSMFANAAIYGFWASSGTASRHKLPRAYSSEIVGFGASPVKAASTKLDPFGDASNNTYVASKGSEIVVDLKKKADDKHKPSVFGFGQVPSDVATRGFTCELVLQQSSVSLGVLRQIKFATEERAIAARTVLSLLAIAGRQLSSESAFLRSGCALVASEEQWGVRRHLQPAPEPLNIGSTDEVIQALRESVDDAEALGLAFEKPVVLHFSAAEKELIKARVDEAMAKLSEGSES